MGGRRGQQQQPRGADAVGAQHDDLAPLPVLVAVAVDPDHGLDQPAASRHQAADPRTGDDLRPGPLCMRPVRQVERTLRSLRAPKLAGPPPGARLKGLVLVGGDGVRAWPPVPAESVRALRGAPARLADGVGRQRVLEPGRVRGVAADAGDADERVDLVVVGREIEIADRPVVGHAVQRPDPEVGRQQPRPLRAVEDARAADRVEHHRGHVGVGHVQRVVRRQLPDVRVVVPLLVDQQLPLGVVGGKVGGVHPVALLQADHAEPALGQRVGHDRA